MRFQSLEPAREETADVILSRPGRNGNDLFGLSYHKAIALIYGGGFLLGSLLFRWVGVGWCPTVTASTAGQEHVAFTLGSFGFVVVLIGAAIIVTIAFWGNLDETWQRLGILAISVGFLISGFWTVAIHRIDIHPDRLVVRGPLLPISLTYSLTNGNKVVTRIQHRDPGNGLVTRRRRLTTYSVHYIRSDGIESVLHNGRGGPPTWSLASARFEQVHLPK